MIARTMVQAQLPKHIDALQMVRERCNLQGIVACESLLRVQQTVLSIDSPLSASLHFSKEPMGESLLTGKCQAQVSVSCERCLEPMSIQIESSFSYGLVFSDEQAKHLSKELEPVLLDEFGQLDLQELLEDELLLSLPAVPKHENEDCFEELKRLNSQTIEIKKDNPFAVLDTLKQTKST